MFHGIEQMKVNIGQPDSRMLMMALKCRRSSPSVAIIRESCNILREHTHNLVALDILFIELAPADDGHCNRNFVGGVGRDVKGINKVFIC